MVESSPAAVAIAISMCRDNQTISDDDAANTSRAAGLPQSTVQKFCARMPLIGRLSEIQIPCLLILALSLPATTTALPLNPELNRVSDGIRLVWLNAVPLLVLLIALAETIYVIHSILTKYHHTSRHTQFHLVLAATSSSLFFMFATSEDSTVWERSILYEIATLTLINLTRALHCSLQGQRKCQKGFLWSICALHTSVFLVIGLLKHFWDDPTNAGHPYKGLLSASFPVTLSMTMVLYTCLYWLSHAPNASDIENPPYALVDSVHSRHGNVDDSFAACRHQHFEPSRLLDNSRACDRTREMSQRIEFEPLSEGEVDPGHIDQGNDITSAELNGLERSNIMGAPWGMFAITDETEES